MKRSVLVMAGLIFASLSANAVPPGTDADVRARLQPFGNVCRAGEDCGSAAAVASGVPLTGEQVYNQFCFACHATGVSGAPLFGDAGQWEPRIAKGLDELYATTVTGIAAMPPKGTCMSCSDDELNEAVDFMIDKAK